MVSKGPTQEVKDLLAQGIRKKQRHSSRPSPYTRHVWPPPSASDDIQDTIYYPTLAKEPILHVSTVHRSHLSGGRLQVATPSYMTAAISLGRMDNKQAISLTLGYTQLCPKQKGADDATMKQPVLPAATDQIHDLLETELQCGVCKDLIVKAVTLNCGHAFCSLCIKRWISAKKGGCECTNCWAQSTCPHCRAPVEILLRSRVMDNILDRAVNLFFKDKVEERRELTEEREREEAKYDVQQ